MVFRHPLCLSKRIIVGLPCFSNIYPNTTMFYVFFLLFFALADTGFKGLVHPKLKIKSLITHPHAVPTP